MADNVNPDPLIQRSLQRAGILPQQQAAPAPGQQQAAMSPDQAAAEAAAEQQAAAQEEQAAKEGTRQDMDRATDQAVKDTSPKDAGDQQQQPPATFKIKDGDSELELTESQILGMRSRYNDLNRKHMTMKPALAVVEQLMERAGSDDEAANRVANFMMSAIDAFTKNPQMGADKPNEQKDGDEGEHTGKSSVTADQVQEQLRQWAEANDLNDVGPLGLLVENQMRLENMFAAGANMLQDIHSKINNQSDATNQQAQQTQQDMANVERTRLANNFDAVQQHYNLSDEDLDPLLNFATERGYMLEEFLNLDLLNKVANDFVNARKAQRADSLEQRMTQRQAFTGSLGSTPGAAGPAPAPSPQQSRIDRIVDGKMGRA